MPTLPTEAQAPESTTHLSKGQDSVQEEVEIVGGKWEDEEERRFFEDIQDLRDFVPKSVLGLDENDGETKEAEKAGNEDTENEEEARKKEMEEREARELESELKRLELNDVKEEPKATGMSNGDAHVVHYEEDPTDDE